MPFDDDANRVEIQIGGEDIFLAESYEVIHGIMQQPSAFSLRLGSSRLTTGALAAICAPNASFRLMVNGVVQFTGATDGFSAGYDGNGRHVDVRGRSTISRLFDACIKSEQGLADGTFADLVNMAIADAYGGFDTKPKVTFSNEANRKAITRAPVEDKPPPVGDKKDAEEAATSPESVAKKIQTKIGEKWLTVLNQQLERAGLFLWAAGDGAIVCATPNTKQAPAYRIFRDRSRSNVLQAEWKNETTGRFSRCDVHGRFGGGKTSRGKVFGTYEDKEMVGFGLVRALTINDPHAKNIQHAEFLARRKIAETCRAGWSLSYTVAGHATPSLANEAPAIWAPDTVVQVDDDEFDIHDVFWVEAVAHRGGAQKTTSLQLMRIGDCLFGTEPPPDPTPSGGAASGPPKPRTGTTTVRSAMVEKAVMKAELHAQDLILQALEKINGVRGGQ